MITSLFDNFFTAPPRPRPPPSPPSRFNPRPFGHLRFEVLPCSATRKWLELAIGTSAPSSSCINAEPQEIVPGANVTFSYDVRWQESDTPWINRWDAYLAMHGRKPRENCVRPPPSVAARK